MLQELLEKCNPLGMFDSIATLAVASNMKELYRLVLVDTPLAPYFSESLTAGALRYRRDRSCLSAIHPLAFHFCVVQVEVSAPPQVLQQRRCYGRSGFPSLSALVLFCPALFWSRLMSRQVGRAWESLEICLFQIQVPASTCVKKCQRAPGRAAVGTRTYCRNFLL